MAYKIHKNGMTYECDTLPELIGMKKVLSHRPRGPHMKPNEVKHLMKPARMYGVSLTRRKKHVKRGIAMLYYLKDSPAPVEAANLMKVIRAKSPQDFSGVVSAVRAALVSRSMPSSLVFGKRKDGMWHAGDDLEKGINALKQYIKEGK